MRLFTAFLLSEEMKDALTDAQEQLRAQGVKGNYSARENLHVTLAFIGEYPDPEEVLGALETVSFRPVRFSLDGIGAFGDLWWAGLSGAPALEAVAKKVRRSLSDAEIPFDRKRFRAHVTLLRRASAQTIPPVGIPPVSMTADRISLMRSDRGKAGMIYTEIGSLPADR